MRTLELVSDISLQARDQNGVIEYDTNFIGESGIEVRIVYQGPEVVANRRELLNKMASRTIVKVNSEEGVA